MFLRPFLLIYRKRLTFAAIFSVLSPVFLFFLVAADSPFDVGVFWHHVCGCPPDPRDARTVLNAFLLTSMILPIILGMSAGFAGARTSGLRGDATFLLTRPLPRRSLILQPLAVASGACAILPALGWLLVLGWLRMVHAPSLGYLVTAAEMIPSASALGPHPSFFALMSALYMGRRYLAALSVGLSLYVFFAMGRWLVLNPDPRLQMLGSCQFLIIIFPWYPLLGGGVFSAMMLAPPDHSLAYLPSNLGIGVHLVLAAVFLYGAWLALQRVEL